MTYHLTKNMPARHTMTGLGQHAILVRATRKHPTLKPVVTKLLDVIRSIRAGDQILEVSNDVQPQLDLDIPVRIGG